MAQLYRADFSLSNGISHVPVASKLRATEHATGNVDQLRGTKARDGEQRLGTGNKDHGRGTKTNLRESTLHAHLEEQKRTKTFCCMLKALNGLYSSDGPSNNWDASCFQLHLHTDR